MACKGSYQSLFNLLTRTTFYQQKKKLCTQVPKYIANKWEKAPSSIEVGKLKINRYAHLVTVLHVIFIIHLFIRVYRNASQKVQVSLTLSESMLCMDTDNSQESIPRNHRLDVTPVTKQMLGVFSQCAGNLRVFHFACTKKKKTSLINEYCLKLR